VSARTRIFCLCITACISSSGRCQALTPVSPEHVTVNDAFWTPRLDTNHTITRAHVFDHSESGKATASLRASYLASDVHVFDEPAVFKTMQAAIARYQRLYPGRSLTDIWKETVSARLYPNGAMVVGTADEGFGAAYDLASADPGLHICGALSYALWNHRLFLTEKDADYLDVLERFLYNGLLSVLMPDGRQFLYRLPLTDSGTLSPEAWFDTLCSPADVSGYVASLPGLIYAHEDDTLYVGLWIGSRVQWTCKGNTVRLEQTGGYPWDGQIDMTVEPEHAQVFSLALRIPGWALGRPVPSDLYHYIAGTTAPSGLWINDQPVRLNLSHGFAWIRRYWKPGDRVRLELPMAVRRVCAQPQVAACSGKVAIERGPLLYCLSAWDNPGDLHALLLPDNAHLDAAYRHDLLNGLSIITGPAVAFTNLGALDGPARKQQTLTAIPYYAWAQRGPRAMTTWIAREPQALDGPSTQSTLTPKNRNPQ